MATLKDIKPDKLPAKGTEVLVFYTPNRGLESLEGLNITISGDLRCFLRIILTAEEKLQLIKSLLEGG